MRSDPRPRLVTWLSLGVLIFATVFVTRFLVGLRLPDLPLTVPRWYFSLTGAFWGTIGLAIAVGLFIGRPQAPTLTRWSSAAFVVWYWIDRLLLVRSDYALRTWPLAAALTILGLAGLWAGLSRPSTKAYFGETVE